MLTDFFKNSPLSASAKAKHEQRRKARPWWRRSLVAVRRVQLKINNKEDSVKFLWNTVRVRRKGWGARRSVHHERVRLHGRGRVVQRVRVLRGLALQLALVRQRSRAAVAEESE